MLVMAFALFRVDWPDAPNDSIKEFHLGLLTQECRGLLSSHAEPALLPESRRLTSRVMGSFSDAGKVASVCRSRPEDWLAAPARPE